MRYWWGVQLRRAHPVIGPPETAVTNGYLGVANVTNPDEGEGVAGLCGLIGGQRMPDERIQLVATNEALDRSARVHIAGHRGLAGSAIWRALSAAGFSDLVGARSSEVDLRDRAATFDYLLSTRPDAVVLAAARVGGIVANNTYPAEFLSENLQIQVNVMDAAHAAGVQRLLFLGSSCIYPKFAEQPIRESSLLTGALEPTNDAYAIAKIAGIMQVQAHRRQYGVRWISAMPTNLYGPGDNFDPENSHVLPALLRRFHEAVESGADSVVLWGSGTPRREFLHVDDLGRAVVHLLDVYDEPETINVGVGEDVTIRELAETVADVVGFAGEIVQDTSRPDGTPRKLLDVTRLRALGWEPRIPLREGIESTYRWFLEHRAEARL
ncbi:GDP-L-fucose synthase [Pseudonocardia aurantiaca]